MAGASAYALQSLALALAFGRLPGLVGRDDGSGQRVASVNRHDAFLSVQIDRGYGAHGQSDLFGGVAVLVPVGDDALHGVLQAGGQIGGVVGHDATVFGRAPVRAGALDRVAFDVLAFLQHVLQTEIRHRCGRVERVEQFSQLATVIPVVVGHAVGQEEPVLAQSHVVAQGAVAAEPGHIHVHAPSPLHHAG